MKGRFPGYLWVTCLGCLLFAAGLAILPAEAKHAPMVSVAPVLCDEAERRLDNCLGANNRYLEVSAAELTKIARSCGKLDSFLNVDVYTGFSPDHPACGLLRKHGVVLPKECRSWESRRFK